MDTTNSSRGDDQPVDLATRLRAETVLGGAATVLRVYGEIDACTAARWRDILDDAVRTAGERGHLVVDISDVTFMSCRAIFDMAACAKAYRCGGARMSVINPAPSTIDRIVTAAGLTEWLPLYTDLADVTGARPALTDPAARPPSEYPTPPEPGVPKSATTRFGLP
ncbi:anti-sigma factor antagonist [Nocardia rhizosphaerihabitans]|uniref:anti-sigma factor antagonist n=1 Tax=Nocardia rhizosphaerihabitans TaxID=1691570 RepID=UPI00366D175D